MPTLRVDTNVNAIKLPADFHAQMSQKLADMVSKPLKFICVIINTGVKISFAGTSEPCACASFTCIGKIGLEENKRYTEIIQGELERTLGIPPDRCYVNFYDVAKQDVGWNKTTFA